MDIIQKWAYKKNSHGEKDLVHVDTVKNGIACNCICTKCGSRLTAVANKEGVQYKKVSHFSHANKSNCKGETLAHIEAKNIIEKEGYLWLPRYIGKGNYDITKVAFEKVLVEEKINDSKYSADLLCSSQGKTIVVEIIVTHDLEDQKRKFLIDNKIDTLSINVGESLWHGYDDLPENFSNLVLKESKREWDVNEKIDFAKEEEKRIELEKLKAEKERFEREDKELERRRKKRLLRSIGGPTYEEINKRENYDDDGVWPLELSSDMKRKKWRKEMIKESERKVEREMERLENPSEKSAGRQNN